jgi:MSHA biogenesis protein MshN
MSVVNQMLQELDRRRAPFSEGNRLPRELRPLPPPARALPLLPLVVGGGAAALIGIAAVAGWVWWHQRTPAVPAPSAGLVAASAPATSVPAAPAAAPVAAPQAAPIPPTPPVAPANEPASQPAPRGDSGQPALALPAPKAKPPSPAAPPAQPSAAPTAALAQPVIDKAAPALTPRDRAEESYRRGLEDLASGRSADAAASLRQALRQDPGHLDARLALARLLVDQGEGLAAGDLLRAGTQAGAGSADYHGLFAAVLQRLGRHEEAITQYGAALRLMPGNGVWWMGLGISLEGANRRPEARDAFLRAQSAGSLAGDLEAFVEAKLRQLP